MADATQNVPVQINQGGTQLTIASGGALVIDSGATLTISADFTLPAGVDIATASGTNTGSVIATAASQKLGFWGATPVIQQASADQAATALVSSTNAATLADVATLQTLVLAMRTALVNTGIIKGAA